MMVVGLVPEPDLGVRDDPEYFAFLYVVLIFNLSSDWCSSDCELWTLKRIMRFEFRLPGKVVFGKGAIRELGAEVRELGKRALLVSGRSAMRKSGTLEKVITLLRNCQIETELYDKIEPDPSLETVDRGIRLAKERKCDMVIGLGGGSALDCAKAIAGIINQEGSVWEYYEGREIDRKGIPFIALPTTSGTGTEVTSNSVLRNLKDRAKKSLRSRYLTPYLALVDPELTLSLPPEVTGYSGIDALTHAVESYVSNAANPITETLAIYSIELVAGNIIKAYCDGEDIDARENMSLASIMAGMSFANSGLGAAHALAHPLGAKFGVSHGIACGILLPYVMEFNLKTQEEKYAQIAIALGKEKKGAMAVEAVRNLLEKLKMPEHLSDVGVERGYIPGMAEDAKKAASLKGNPRPATEKELIDILISAY
jgi:alcohol dehydrogenase class IV